MFCSAQLNPDCLPMETFHCGWNPCPCSTCTFTCGGCTLYFACGDSSANTECTVYWECSNSQSRIKVTIPGNPFPIWESFYNDPLGQGYADQDLSFWNGQTITIQMISAGLSEITCTETRLFGCQ